MIAPLPTVPQFGDTILLAFGQIGFRLTGHDAVAHNGLARAFGFDFGQFGGQLLGALGHCGHLGFQIGDFVGGRVDGFVVILRVARVVGRCEHRFEAFEVSFDRVKCAKFGLHFGDQRVLGGLLRLLAEHCGHA